MHQSRMGYKCHLTYSQTQKMKTCLRTCFLLTHLLLLLLLFCLANSVCASSILGLAHELVKHDIFWIIFSVRHFKPCFSSEVIMIQKSDLLLQDNVTQPTQIHTCCPWTLWSKFSKDQKLSKTLFFHEICVRLFLEGSYCFFFHEHKKMYLWCHRLVFAFEYSCFSNSYSRKILPCS